MIISRYRPNSSKEERKAGSDVRFEEFVQYILELKDRDEVFNPHWESYSKLCHPCTINYDFIGKLDTIQRDAQYIVQKLSHSNECRELPKVFVRSPTTKSFLKEYYSRISKAAIDDLKELYSSDFQLFNFTKSPFESKEDNKSNS